MIALPNNNFIAGMCLPRLLHLQYPKTSWSKNAFIKTGHVPFLKCFFSVFLVEFHRLNMTFQGLSNEPRKRTSYFPLNPGYLSGDSWMYPYGKSLYKPYIVGINFSYIPQESVENTINLLGTLLGLHPSIPCMKHTDPHNGLFKNPHITG